MGELNSSNKIPNRRKYPRELCNTPIEFLLTMLEFYEIKKERVSGTLVDISKGGLGLTTGFPLEPGHVLRFTNVRSDLMVHQAGVVRWTTGEAPYINAGVQFVGGSA